MAEKNMKIKCPKCKSEEIYTDCIIIGKPDRIKYRCKKCNKSFLSN